MNTGACMKKTCKNLAYIFVLFGFVACVTSGYSTIENAPIDYKNEPDSWWKKVLKPDVYQICRKAGTERAFSGIYDKETADGNFFCICL